MDTVGEFRTVPGADGGPVMRGLVARHRAFSSFNQISASKRRNRTS